MNKQLLPCPFCGTSFIDNSYDRRIVYRCPSCLYSRCFPGIINGVINDKPITYVGKDGKPIPPSEIKYQEYYHYEAIENSIEQMNKRYEYT